MIKKVLYTKIPNEEYSTTKAGEFYYHYNLLNLNEDFARGYEEYEYDQTILKNKIIAKEAKKENIHPDINSSILGLSSIKDRVVVICPIR